MNKSFTLLELVIVVIIVGMLAAIGIPQFNKAIWRSRAAEVCSVTSAIVRAQKMYYQEWRSFALADDGVMLGNGTPEGSTNIEKKLGISIPGTCRFQYRVWPTPTYAAPAAISVFQNNHAGWICNYTPTGPATWWLYVDGANDPLGKYVNMTESDCTP